MRIDVPTSADGSSGGSSGGGSEPPGDPAARGGLPHGEHLAPVIPISTARRRGAARRASAAAGPRPLGPRASRAAAVPVTAAREPASVPARGAAPRVTRAVAASPARRPALRIRVRRPSARRPRGVTGPRAGGRPAGRCGRPCHAVRYGSRRAAGRCGRGGAVRGAASGRARLRCGSPGEAGSCWSPRCWRCSSAHCGWVPGSRRSPSRPVARSPPWRTCTRHDSPYRAGRPRGGAGATATRSRCGGDAGSGRAPTPAARERPTLYTGSRRRPVARPSWARADRRVRAVPAVPHRALRACPGPSRNAPLHRRHVFSPPSLRHRATRREPLPHRPLSSLFAVGRSRRLALAVGHS